MTQAVLFPVAVAAVVASPWDSADAREVALGEDSQDYLIKRPLPHHPEHAAAESLGYLLSARCGLAVPVGVRLAFRDGTSAFGSRIEGGVTQFQRLPLEDRDGALRACAPWLSALCALDLFMANNDRHLDNLLLRRSVIDQRWTTLAMDFSRALWVGGFPDTHCGQTLNQGNTALTIALLRFYNLWDASRAGTVAASLSTLTPDTLVSWSTTLPPDWKTPRTDALPTWWASEKRGERIKELLSLL